MVDSIDEYDIKTWVDEAVDQNNLEFRRAVHTILYAIASNSNLKASMILKGGILLAIRYKSYRFTRDLDFSTAEKLGEKVTVDGTIDLLNKSLAQVSEELDYDLDCRVQSYKLKPENITNPTFPGLKMKIGYAYKGTTKQKKLIALKCPTTVPIDYSLNEESYNIENITLDGEEILAYAFTDVVAEKYRSLLQQIERNRSRRQDVFDINLLITKLNNIDDQEKQLILKSLISKSKSRGIDANIHSFDNPEIRATAKKDYPTLVGDLNGELPDFDEIYENIQRFYRSLPWANES